MKKHILPLLFALTVISRAHAGLYDDCLVISSFQINGDTSDFYNYVARPPASGVGIFLHDPSLTNTSNAQGTMVLAAVTSRITYNAGTETLDVNVSDKADASATTTALAGKAETTHTHAESDVTNLVSDLAGKASSSHTHPQSDVTGLVTALSGKFPNPTGTTAQYLKGDGTLGTYSLATGTVTSVIAGTGLSGGTITTSGTVSMPNTGTSGTYSGVTTDAQGRVTAGTTRSFNNSVTLTLVTSPTAQGGSVIDANRDADVTYSVNTSTTATIGGTSSVTAYLEIATTNSVTAGDWTAIQTVGNGQMITLAIALQSVQTNGLTVSGKIPAGYYRRVRYATTGTASCSYVNGQEVKI